MSQMATPGVFILRKETVACKTLREKICEKT